MGEMENLVEFYYEKLKVSVNPGQVLLEFFREITSMVAGRSEIIIINKLIKLFGRFTVYFAILELSRYEKLEGNIYPLLFAICRSRFEKMNGSTYAASHESLAREIASLEKEAEKVRRKAGKMKLPSAEGLD